MERSSPAPDEVWQHFKGHLYKIFCVSTPATEPFDWSLKPAAVTEVKQTETGRTFLIWRKEPESPWIHSAAEEPGQRVIYYSMLNRDATIWARPMISFMSADDRSATGWKFWRIEEQNHV